jgi:hypothetical protein
MEKPNNVIRIPTSIKGDFFKYWFQFLGPFHHLTPREIDIISVLLRKRYELSKVINDTKLLDKVTLGEDVRRQVREECGIKLSHFQVIMASLKKNGVVTEEGINPKYIPNIKEEHGKFQLLLYFDLNEEK